MFSAIDTHVAGEPFRIVTQSPIQLNETDVHGNNERLQTFYTQEKALLINEPRGHRGMTGCVITPSADADFALLFFSHDGSVFKYGGLAAALTALLETGNLAQNESGVYHVETVEGIYALQANLVNGTVERVQFETDTADAFRRQAYEAVTVAGKRDYLIFPVPEEVPDLSTASISEITRWGKAKTEQLKQEEVPFQGVILADTRNADQGSVRSVTFERDGSITRSAGVDSTIALLRALQEKSGKLDRLENWSVFDERITAENTMKSVYQYSVSLQAIVTGTHEFVFDETDPLGTGFILT
jgi:proline racemase